jgi:hypothetical protein
VFPSPPSIIILLLRSTQASAPKSILRLSLKAYLGATQVATSSSDSAAYGDHYPFSDISGNNDICPAGFGVPTERELAAETISATINNPGDAISSFLKLPAAGSGATSSNNWAGSTIFLWTKTVSGGQGRYLTIAPNNINIGSNVHKQSCHPL